MRKGIANAPGSVIGQHMNGQDPRKPKQQGQERLQFLPTKRRNDIKKW